MSLIHLLEQLIEVRKTDSLLVIGLSQRMKEQPVFPGGTVVKNLPVQQTQEMWVQSLGWEGPLEEEMIAHSSILAWEIS